MDFSIKAYFQICVIFYGTVLTFAKTLAVAFSSIILESYGMSQKKNIPTNGKTIEEILLPQDFRDCIPV